MIVHSRRPFYHLHLHYNFQLKYQVNERKMNRTEKYKEEKRRRRKNVKVIRHFGEDEWALVQITSLLVVACIFQFCRKVEYLTFRVAYLHLPRVHSFFRLFICSMSDIWRVYAKAMFGILINDDSAISQWCSSRCCSR